MSASSVMMNVLTDFNDLKFALLLFDQIHIPIHSEGITRVLDFYKDTFPQSIIPDLLNIIIPVPSIPKISDQALKLLGQDLRNTRVTGLLEDIAKTYIKKKNFINKKGKFDENLYLYALYREIGWTMFGIEHDLILTQKLKTAYYPYPVLLPVVKQMFLSEYEQLHGMAGIEVLKDVVEENVPDFSKMTMEEILELRSEGTISDFRKRIRELSTLAVEAKKSIEIRALVDHELKRDLWALARDVKPNIPVAFLKALVSNIPLPVPNPMGIIDSGYSVYKGLKLNRTYGWLFFIAEMRRKQGPKHTWQP